MLDAAPDERILYALTVAPQWVAENVPTGIAMKAFVAAHAAARAATNPIKDDAKQVQLNAVQTLIAYVQNLKK